MQMVATTVSAARPATPPIGLADISEDTVRFSGSCKYLYAEFAGWTGERYLKKLLRQILPMALYRTWEIFAEHQAHGNECYLGISQLAALAGRTLRTMQKNLAVLQARQLMIERAERKVFGGPDEKPHHRAVVVKDFAPLYALAHEYHEWLQAADYLAPDRAVVALMTQETRLVAKLRRFENYRRVLYTHLPGPPPHKREEDRWFTEYQAEVDSEAVSPERTTRSARAPEPPPVCVVNKQVGQEVAEPPAKDSPKRITERPQNHPPSGDSCDSVGSPSPRSQHQERGRYPSPDGMPGAEKEGEQARHEEQAASKGREGSPMPQPISPLPLTTSVVQDQQQSEQRRQSMGTPGEQERLASGQRDLEQSTKQRVATLQDRLVHSFVQTIAAPFGDRNPRGSLTRLSSILARAQCEQPAEVVWCLVRAYTVARDTRTIRAVHCDPRTGHVNRMPLFCAMVERFVQARVPAQQGDSPWQQIEAEIAADERLLLWWSTQRTEIHDLDSASFLPNASQGALEFPAMSSSISAHTQQETGPRLSATLLRHQRSPRLSQTEEARERRASHARTVLAQFLRMAVVIHDPMVWSEHLLCGCPLYHKRTGKTVCAHCFPDPTWSEEVRAFIHTIIEPCTGGRRSEEAAGESSRRAAEANISEKEGSPSQVPGPDGWTEREHAYAWGARVLKELARSGYIAEMRVRPLEERYQVVLADGACEIVLETAEQGQFLIEQAHALAVKAQGGAR